MNPKIFVGVAVAALAAILGGILLVGPSMEIVTPENSTETPAVIQTKPIEIELVYIEVTKISERNATIEIAFEISNPNQRSIIVQVMDYQLFETGYSEFEQIAGGSNRY